MSGNEYLRNVFTTWSGYSMKEAARRREKRAKEKMAQAASMVVGMLGANAKVMVHAIFNGWKELVTEHRRLQQEKTNEADQEELVEVVKELEQAYHTERYQTRALKERIRRNSL